jgi:hypothetical protein
MSTSIRSARSSIQGTTKKQTGQRINRQKKKIKMAQDERRARKRKLSGSKESIKESSIHLAVDSEPAVVSSIVYGHIRKGVELLL